MDIPGIVAVFNSRHPDAPASIAGLGTGVVISLRGSMDMGMSADADVLLSAALAQAEVGCPFIVDLAGVDYISSTGVGSLVTALALARKRNIPLSLRNMTEKVRGILALLGFLQFFDEEGPDE